MTTRVEACTSFSICFLSPLISPPEGGWWPPASSSLSCSKVNRKGHSNVTRCHHFFEAVPHFHSSNSFPSPWSRCASFTRRKHTSFPAPVRGLSINPDLLETLAPRLHPTNCFVNVARSTDLNFPVVEPLQSLGEFHTYQEADRRLNQGFLRHHESCSCQRWWAAVGTLTGWREWSTRPPRVAGKPPVWWPQVSIWLVL